MFRKQISIDDTGWGEPILGAVIGAHKLPDHKYMEHRIPVSAFQSPNFERKRYWEYAVKIAREIVKVMRADKETSFKVCSGYMLSDMRKYLWDRGFPVIEVEITGELQERVKRGFIKWCVEVGVPVEKLESRGDRVAQAQKRFWAFLEWVAEKPKLREKLVKTGWKSWKEKWREQAFKERF